MKILLGVALILCSFHVLSGTLVKNGKIVKMSNISSNQDRFLLGLDGSGEGPCVGKSVSFYAPIQKGESLKRTVALASLALTTDLYVQVHNYSDDACGGATFIQVSKIPL